MVTPTSTSAPTPSRHASASSTASRYAPAGRSLPMDMLRGIAILLVLGRHYVVAPENVGFVQPVATFWTTIGWSGVDLFFVLSGFLVSGLIFAEYRQRGAVDVRRFVIRRGFKIWPPYLVFIAVVAAWLGWLQWHGRGGDVWSQLWPNVFHVQNYFHTPRVHTWSLAVEEHFYLGAALVFYWLLGRGRGGAALRHLPVFVGACIVGLATWRHFGFLRHGPDELNLYATHLRFDGLLVGTLLAYWTHFEPQQLARLTRHPVMLLIAGAALAAPTLIVSPEASAWAAGVGLTGVYVGFGLVMLGWMNLSVVYPAWNRCLEGTGAALLGRVGFYSYSIYLWHVDLARTPVYKLAQAATAQGVPSAVVWMVANVVYVALAVLTGMVLARWLEIPSLALRDRLFPSVVKPGVTIAKEQRTAAAVPPMEAAPLSTLAAEATER